MADVKHSRNLSPEDYDSIIICRCVQVLNEASFGNAAKLLEKKVII